MDNALERAVNVPEMVRRALGTQELKQLYDDSRLTEEAIIAEVEQKLPDLLLSAGDALRVWLKAAQEVEALQRQREEQLRELASRTTLLRLLRYLLTGIAGVASFLALLFLPQPAWLSPFMNSFVRLAWLTLAAWLVGDGGIGCWQWLGRRFGFTNERRKILAEKQLEERQAAAQSILSDIRSAIYQNGVRPEVNGILSRATAPRYETQLGAYTSTGLAEIFTYGHEVQTQSRRDLEDLMTLPGGSIGLAGARGAGKSTLMTLMALRPGPTGKACSVMCPAPVEYSGRDYLVTLFLLLCNWVLQARTIDGLESRESAKEKPEPPAWMRSLSETGRWLARYLFFAGLICMMLTVSWDLLQRRDPGTETPAAQGNTSQKQVTPPSGSAAVSKTAAPPPESHPDRFLDRIHELFGVDQTVLGRWGLILTGVSIALLVVLGRIMHPFAGATFYQELNMLLQDLAGARVRKREKPAEESDPLLVAARIQRESLRFQQSYTSGWSGSLKLPIGLEGGLNEARSLSRNQRSLPELVLEFREFLQKLAAEYGRVTIAIDELDKMESDDKAHLFLNEIKAIFGVRNVFYLVSVSENAISAFERRGLPFRDVFDSSFDAIVHVNYMKLEETKVLLKRRTTRIPEPFLCLCHCLSGGLPRDSIRACRDMLNLAEEVKEFELLPLARHVITQETRSKARGMSIALSKLRTDADHTMFLGALTELLGRKMDEAELLARATLLLRGADGLQQKMAGLPLTDDENVRSQVAQLSALAQLEMEFGLYLTYAATVLEVMVALNSIWPKAATELTKPIEQRQGAQTIELYCNNLAAVRQALAVSVPMGRGRLTKLRSELGMDVKDIRPPQVAAEGEGK